MYVDRQNDNQREEGEDEEEKDDVSFEGEIDDWVWTAASSDRLVTAIIAYLDCLGTLMGHLLMMMNELCMYIHTRWHG